MEPRQLERWRTEALSRLDAFRLRIRQTRQFLDARGLDKLSDNDGLMAAWDHIRELFPDDFHPDRASDLRRHLRFSDDMILLTLRKWISLP